MRKYPAASRRRFPKHEIRDDDDNRRKRRIRRPGFASILGNVKANCSLFSSRICFIYTYAEVPPRVEYSITEYGRGLNDILQQMHEWGVAHLEHMTKKNSR
ncbi:winged helix-turn-helix transcriptional regulator [Paenibacillus tarimensis]